MIKIIDYNNQKELIANMLERTNYQQSEIQTVVNKIISDVKLNGDMAIIKYAKKFDNTDITPETLLFTKKEIADAYNEVSKDLPELIDILKRASKRITDYHLNQKSKSWITHQNEGEILGQLVNPVEIAGIYVPGGKAAYPSSVLMNVIPAKVAGVSRIIMATPNPNGLVNPLTLVAADIAGVDQIYKMGGAQAIAAMAFGTATVPRVDKIVGPGNIYVALAKRSVFGYTSIDSVAGPSEILIIADDTANPDFVASDLLSQAEHDELASSILITTDTKLAKSVQESLFQQTAELSRQEIINKSIENYGAIVIVSSLDEAFELSNKIAPEHLEICVKDPFTHISKVKNAGAVFLGDYSPEPLGDYMAGTNHILPTGGTARFFSPLGVDDFIKKSSLISFNKDSLSKLQDDIVKFADAEGFTAHANAVSIRF